MAGIFTISLDFELHWGVFDKHPRDERIRCYEHTLEIIPRMLDLFSRYGVHATWATVGSLMAEDEEEWKRFTPRDLPVYEQQKFSAYEYMRKYGLPIEKRKAHFASEIVREIIRFPGQELGTHTYSHYYCLEPPLDSRSFASDLRAASAIAREKYDRSISSMVFPRNQFNPAILKICFENGIRAVRSNPAKWFWTPIRENQTSFLRKAFRSGDAYVPLGKRTSYPLASLSLHKDEPIQLPASRLLRPWNEKHTWLHKMHLARMINELKTAAVLNECYHLWWHPENFGYHPQQNIELLELLLKAFNDCRQRYGMTSLNMGEYPAALEKGRKMEHQKSSMSPML